MTKKILAFILLAIFVASEYFFRSRIESISLYASYGLEVLIILFTLLGLGEFELFKIKSPGKVLLFLPLALVVGAIVHYVAKQQLLIIPFDFNSSEVMLFLLFIGPVLEELLFRGALWRMLKELLPIEWLLVLLTAALFSYSHYQVIHDVPATFKPFIEFQAGYTLALGLGCGFTRLIYGLIPAIFIHAAFNFGFWLVTIRGH